MGAVPVADIIQLRRDTAINWTTVNPVLADGEIGIEKGNPIKYKVGDGVTAWNSLTYGMKGEQGIQGVAGNSVIKEVEVDFGSNSVMDKVFNVVDTDITEDTKVIANKVLKSPSNGRHIDEIYCETLEISTKPNAGSVDLYIRSLCGKVSGKFIINYIIG
jgi:hypothetical protein